MKCEKCGYEWQTVSKHKYVCCPHCQQKVKNLDVEQEFKRVDKGAKAKQKN